MRRMVLLCSTVAALVSCLVTIGVMTLAVPAIAEAQQARVSGEAVAVVGGNGTEQVRLWSRPTGGGVVQALSAEGKLRAQLATGGAAPGQPPNPAAAGVNVYGVDGETEVGRLGTIGTVTSLSLSNESGQSRARLSLGGGAAGAEPDAAVLNLWGPEGPSEPAMVHLAVDHGPTGEGPLVSHLVIRDTEAQQRIFIGTTESGRAIIQIRDAEGNVVWSAP